MRLDPAFTLGGPSTCFTHTVQALPGLAAARLYQDAASVAQIGRRVHARFRGQYRVVPRLGGFCLFFRRDVVRRIGFFDERFGLGSGEEDDFVCRARAAGHRAVWAKAAYVHHFGHCSFSAELGAASAELWRRNRLIFEIKRLVPGLGEIVHAPAAGPSGPGAPRPAAGG
jgi:GT2 family glycosyltransferase